MASSGERTGGYVVLTGTVEREGDQFASYCVQLGVASCGDTIEEAFDNLGDAIEVYLDALEEIGTLEGVFKEKRIDIHAIDPSLDIVTVSVPPEQTIRTYLRQVPLAGVA